MVAKFLRCRTAQNGGRKSLAKTKEISAGTVVLHCIVLFCFVLIVWNDRPVSADRPEYID